MVDRFWNGDPSNDGADADPADPQGWHGGDLRGVIEKLDHLQHLGIRTVWLSPIFQSRGEKHGDWGAFHGYWTWDPYEIEPRFGSEGDLKELADALHARGMRLVLDFVANHVGPGAPLLREHPDWVHGEGDVRDWNDAAQVLSHDVHGLPDLAQEREDVADWLIGAGRKWVRVAGIDGYRLDAVKHVPSEFWRRFNGEMRATAGDEFLLIGEYFDGDPWALARAWEAGGFGYMFDFPLYFAVLDSTCGGADPRRVDAVLSQDRAYGARAGGLVGFADNHDVPRLFAACGGDAASAEAVLARIAAERAQVSVTWGTETAAAGGKEPENRASMDWSATGLFGPRLREILGRRAPDRPRPSTGERARVGLTLVGAPLLAGDELRVVGAGPELGNWDPRSGLLAEPDEGEAGALVARAELPRGSMLEFKLALLRANGGVEWEARGNRYLRADRAAQAVELRWGAAG
jgi:glycosidase